MMMWVPYSIASPISRSPVSTNHRPLFITAVHLVNYFFILLQSSYLRDNTRRHFAKGRIRGCPPLSRKGYVKSKNWLSITLTGPWYLVIMLSVMMPALAGKEMSSPFVLSVHRKRKKSMIDASHGFHGENNTRSG